MFDRRYLFVKILIVIGTLLFSGCQATNLSPDVNVSAQTNEIDANFIAMITSEGVDDVNSGISIVSIGSAPNKPERISFDPLNHTDEAIAFPDRGFAMKFYWYDEDTGYWKQIESRIHRAPQPVLLPAHKEEVDVARFASFDQSDLVGSYSWVRVLIQGSGVSTGKTYAAYVDFDLQTEP